MEQKVKTCSSAEAAQRRIIRTYFPETSYSLCGNFTEHKQKFVFIRIVHIETCEGDVQKT